MLGRGLGEILTHTQVSHTLVHKIVYGIGINTQRRVKIGIVFSSFIIVSLLGTLAGGLRMKSHNAVICNLFQDKLPILSMTIDI